MTCWTRDIRASTFINQSNCLLLWIFPNQNFIINLFFRKYNNARLIILIFFFQEKNLSIYYSINIMIFYSHPHRSLSDLWYYRACNAHLIALSIKNYIKKPCTRRFITTTASIVQSRRGKIYVNNMSNGFFFSFIIFPSQNANKKKFFLQKRLEQLNEWRIVYAIRAGWKTIILRSTNFAIRTRWKKCSLFAQTTLIIAVFAPNGFYLPIRSRRSVDL